MDSDPDTQLYYDFSPFLRHYKSGRIERLIPEDFVPASHDPTTGVTSKDVVIDPESNISARLYIPDLSNDNQEHEGRSENKLPILIYIHGGGFVLPLAFSSVYHRYINSVVSKARVLAVSVKYRVSPEHPLPTAYNDAYLALKWVISNCSSGPDTWLSEHGDPSRIFVAGDSAGGNIAHNTVMKAGKDRLHIKGLALFHPYFWGKDPVGSDTTDPVIRTGAEKSWNYICDGAFGIDDPCVNPISPMVEWEKFGCERVLVTVADKDHFRERGKAYVEVLKKSGWKGEAELLVSEGEEHVFFLGKPECEKALEMMEMVVSFLNK